MNYSYFQSGKTIYRNLNHDNHNLIELFQNKKSKNSTDKNKKVSHTGLKPYEDEQIKNFHFGVNY